MQRRFDGRETKKLSRKHHLYKDNCVCDELRVYLLHLKLLDRWPRTSYMGNAAIRN